MNIFLLLIVNSIGEVIIPIQITQQTPTLTLQQITKSTTSDYNTLTTVTQVQQLKVRLQRSPMYAYPGIIIDLIVTPAFQYTQDELEDMFSYQINDPQYLPPRAYISQGQTNQQVRILFDYQNNIPYKPFVAVFKIKNNVRPQLGQARIGLVLDSLSSGITSALHPDDYREDVLR